MNIKYLRSEKTWEELNLDQEQIKLLKMQKFFKPSKIQSMSIPVLIKRKDFSLIAQSQNGSGKTLSFLLPMINLVSDRYNPVQNR